MKSNFLKTIAANWRDLLAFAIFGLGLATLSGLIDFASGRYADSGIARLVLPTVANYLGGFSAFTGASLCATLVWMWLWPTVSEFGNNRFTDGWQRLTPKERLLVYVWLVSTALIAAALCFSP